MENVQKRNTHSKKRLIRTNKYKRAQTSSSFRLKTVLSKDLRLIHHLFHLHIHTQKPPTNKISLKAPLICDKNIIFAKNKFKHDTINDRIRQSYRRI